MSSGTRRAQAAAQTRELILRAALERFQADGYVKATVSDIAKSAGVVVATVYTSVGGKPVLLEELVRAGMADAAVHDSLERVGQAGTGREAIDALAAGTGATWRKHEASIQLLLSTADAHEPIAERLLAEAVSVYRERLALVAARLVELDALAEGLDAARATEGLWFFFGLRAWPRLLSESAWDWASAQEWLRDAAARALLRDK